MRPKLSRVAKRRVRRLVTRLLAFTPLLWAIGAVSRQGGFPPGIRQRLASLELKCRRPVVASFRLPRRRSMSLSLLLDDPLQRIFYFCFTHEPGTTAFLARRFQDPALAGVFDVGSNVGYYAVMAASMLRGRGWVDAFEPIPWIFERLGVNKALNALENLRVYRIACSDRSGNSLIYLPLGSGAWSTQATLLGDLAREWARSSAGQQEATSLSVATVALDDHVRAAGRVPDLVRMDIEGGEPAALNGMSRLLRDRAPDLVVEVLPAAVAPLKELLARYGYTAYWIKPDGWLARRPLEFVPGNWDWYATRRLPETYLR